MKRVLWLIYCGLVIFIGLLAFVRLCSLLYRIRWRNDLDGNFPSDCGDWAKKCGCTRVLLDKDQCVREDEIPSRYTIAFNVGEESTDDRVLNSRIHECVQNSHSSKLITPKDLGSSSKSGELIHISWTSAVFGFLDDMYIKTEVYEADPSIRILNIQS